MAEEECMGQGSFFFSFLFFFKMYTHAADEIDLEGGETIDTE